MTTIPQEPANPGEDPGVPPDEQHPEVVPSLPDPGPEADPEMVPDTEPRVAQRMVEKKRTSDPASAPGVTADAKTGTVAHDDIAETDDRELPHPPATATEELDEGVVSKTDDGPDRGVSPGVG